jgi:hypothetical protein
VEEWTKKCDFCHALVIPKSYNIKTKEFIINGRPICGLVGTETAGLDSCPAPSFKRKKYYNRGGLNV